MDGTTVGGLLVGLLIMAGAIFVGGAPFATFLDVPAILCVVGGSASAVLVGFPASALAAFPRTLAAILWRRPPSAERIVERILTLAETARRQGMLALETQLPEERYPLLAAGLQMAVDGTKPDVIAEVLHAEISAVSDRQRICRGILEHLGKSCPGFGLIGTLLGLVMMLSNMTDPSSIGRGMGVALLTTLYGAVLSNLVCLPLAEKVAFHQREEIRAMELIVQGVLAIQSGEPPRVIERKLRASQVVPRRALAEAA